jgi:hypothetical protein
MIAYYDGWDYSPSVYTKGDISGFKRHLTYLGSNSFFVPDFSFMSDVRFPVRNALPQKGFTISFWILSYYNSYSGTIFKKGTFSIGF